MSHVVFYRQVSLTPLKFKYTTAIPKEFSLAVVKKAPPVECTLVLTVT